MRYKVQLHFWVIATIWAAVAFVLSWIALVFGSDFLMGSRSMSLQWAFISSGASVIGLLTGGFFVGCGIYLFHKTSGLDTWNSIAPSLLVERFSKLHR
ncbi:hypothetical protein [Pseudomonas sp. RW3S2]|uniref:hypothetical protein n=1 Tax=Pseudomonas sp. RW3S2 TaxID=485884 RepID=UPI0016774149|nr:hypothetical protein [Pseudomonas sp. RW3S2]